MKKAIVEVSGKGKLTHADLNAGVEKKLEGRFDGSIPRYLEATERDLEARGIIERVPGERRDVYRVKR